MARPTITAISALTGTVQPITNWDRDARGSADRVQLRHYSVAVAVAMGMTYADDNLTCLHCGEAFHVPSTGDVDRTNGDYGYAPGRVVMVCRMCNETRGHMQRANADMAGAARYAADVWEASRTVDVPTKATAKAARSTWVGVIRQRVGGMHWVMMLARSPYFNA